MKKVLWVNPSFLDYRIPLYDELNKLYQNNFHLIYSKQRVPQRCIDKIESVLKENALGLLTEKNVSIGKKDGFANSRISLPFPKGLYRLIKSVKADIVIAEGFFQFTPWALAYAIFNRKPILIAYERTAHTERNCPAWRRMYRKFVNLFVDGYVVNGILTKQYLVSQGVSENVIFTGAMCADSFHLAEKVKMIKPEERLFFKRELHIEKKEIIYLYVGQLITRKGVAYLLDAWKEHILSHPNDHLLIVGEGPLFDDFVQGYGFMNSISFVGNIDYSRISEYYAVADVFVIPTLEDNWSLVVPEAMACGLPIACSVYNGCHPELVHEGKNGVLFDTLNKASLLYALSYFHSVDLELFGKESMKIEQKYNPQNTARNIFKAIETVAEK